MPGRSGDQGRKKATATRSRPSAATRPPPLSGMASGRSAKMLGRGGVVVDGATGSGRPGTDPTGAGGVAPTVADSAGSLAAGSARTEYHSFGPSSRLASGSTVGAMAAVCTGGVEGGGGSDGGAGDDGQSGDL